MCDESLDGGVGEGMNKPQQLDDQGVAKFVFEEEQVLSIPSITPICNVLSNDACSDDG